MTLSKIMDSMMVLSRMTLNKIMVSRMTLSSTSVCVYSIWHFTLVLSVKEGYCYDYCRSAECCGAFQKQKSSYISMRNNLKAYFTES